MKIRKSLASIVIIIISITILLGIFSFTASATEITASGTCGDNLTWTLDSEGVLTISGSGEMKSYLLSPWRDYRSSIKKVVIEEGVTSIGSYVFKGCSALTSITIPDSVTSIGNDAFSDCIELTSITVPDSVTEIGYSAFTFCSKLENITIPFVGLSADATGEASYFGAIFGYVGSTSSSSDYHFEKDGYYYTFLIPSSLKNVTIGNTTSSIGDYAFNKCTGLESISISDSVTSIGNYAFNKCTGLTSITVPDTVTSIGDCAFSGCTELKSAVVGNGVKTIGHSAFEGCTKLESITIPFIGSSKNATGYSSHFGVIFGYSTSSYSYSGYNHFKDDKYYYKYSIPSSLKSVTISNATSSIGDYAFNKCTGLANISIPNSVKSIGDYAFYGCAASTSIPEGVTSIGDYAFYGHIELTNVPNSVTSIGNYAFYGCTALTGIPDSITTIGNHTFSGCTGLTSIPNSVTSIGDYGFYGCKALAGIPNSVTSIGDYAFYGCTALTGIPNSVTSIGDYAFYDCTGLTSIPNSVTSIGDYAFGYCTKLTDITIPDSVTSIGCGAFYGCTKLESITIPFIGSSKNATGYSSHFGYIFDISIVSSTLPSKYHYCDDRYYYEYHIPSSLKSVTISGVTSNIGDYAFNGCTGLTSITIPDGVTSIGNYAFKECTGLSSITIPNSVTSIGIYALGACTRLTSITIPDSVISIGASAFNRCTGLTSITIPNSVTSIGIYAFKECTGLTSITVPDTVTSIGDYAFSGCTGLKSAVVGNGVKTMGHFAFEGCTKLESITIPFIGSSKNATGYSSHFGVIFGYSTSSYSYSGYNHFKDDKYYYKYSIPSSLKSVTISNATSSIGDYAFNKCTGLANISIPNSVKSIGDYAFYGCAASTSIPEGVTSIGDYAFYGHIELTNVPNSVTSIGNYAFYGCTALTGIPDSITTIGNHTFSRCTGLMSITIPDTVTSIGDYAFCECTGLTSIFIPNSVTSIGYYAFRDCNSVKINFGDTIEKWNSIEKRTQGDTQNAFYVHCTDGITCFNHTEAIDEAIAPTCTVPGLTEGKHCEVCLETLVAQETVKELGHNYTDEYSFEVAPTSTREGYTIYTCTNCGNDYHGDYVEAKGYDWILEDGKFNLLLIGNSFSEDASNCGSGMKTSQMLDILRAMLGDDVEITVGLFYSGGKGLNWHATQAYQGNKACSLRVIDTKTGTWKSYGTMTAEDALQWTEWDIVSLQHYEINPSTGKESNAYPEGVDSQFDNLEAASTFLLDYIDKYAPNAEAYFYMVWSRAYKSNLNEALSDYNKRAAYLPIVMDYIAAESGRRFESIIPVGLSMQNARTTYLALLAYNTTAYADGNLNLYTDAQIGLQRDGGHLSFNVGRYIAALTFAEMLVPEELRADGYVLPNIRVTESVGKLPKEYTEIAQKAVWAAVNSWKNGSLDVTNIEGYEVDPTSNVGEILSALVLNLHCGDDNSLAEQIRMAVLATLPVDFAVDNVDLDAENGVATLTIRFGYTSVTIEMEYSITSHLHTPTVVAPSCTEQGYTTYICYCGDSYIDDYTDVIDHSYGDWYETEVPTCTVAGTDEHKCSVCDYKETRTVNALGHTEVIDKEKAPNCTEFGLTEGKHCSVCNEILVVQEIVSATGHTVSGWSLVDSSVSVNDRIFEGTCVKCSELKQISLEERFKQLTYVTFGDSITYGIDGVDWGLMEDPYPELVSKELGFASFNNLAVSGATFCENTLGRTNMTKKILSYKGEADIISLMLGVNDCYVGLPLGTSESRDNTTIYGSLFLISEYLSQNYEDALIFYMTPFPAKSCYADNSAGYNLEDVANAIKHVAALYDIPVLDMYLYSEYENAEMYNPNGDGLHPSQSFMRDYASPKIVEFIGNYYGVKYTHHHTEVIYNAIAATCTESGLTEGKYCSVCHKVLVVQDVVLPLGHREKSVVENKVDATCIADGSYDSVVYCSVCDVELSREVNSINKLGHNLEHHDAKAPTCTEIGWDAYDTCKRESCTYTTYVEKSVLGHANAASVVENKVNATCTTDGSYDSVVYCSVCEAEVSRETQTINKLGHNYSEEWTEDVAPTCTEKGSKSHHCTRCNGKADVTEISANGHNYGDWYETKAPTCTMEGTDEHKCSVCQHTETRIVNALGHTEADAVVENKVNATCTVNGSYDNVVYCLVCEAEVSREAQVINKLGHTYSEEWTIDLAPTCTEKGSKSHHCIRGDAKVDVTEVAELGHKYDDWYETKAPTCTETGTEAHKCSVCQYTETRTINALGHTEADAVVENKVDATCTTNGSYDSVVYCSVCDAEVSREAQTISKLGHAYSEEWTIDLAPTCTEKGSKSHHCTRCESKADVTEIPVLEHTYKTYWIIDATSHWKECACGEKNEIAEHTWNNGEITKAPSVDAEGVKTYTCTLCSYAKTESIPKFIINIENVDADVTLEVPTESEATIPEGTKLEIVDKSEEQVSDEILGELAETSETVVTTLGVYDLNLVLDGAKIQPGGAVVVTLPAPKLTGEYDRIIVVYIDSDGRYEECKTVVNADGTISFETDHFSKYAVIGISEKDGNKGLGTGAIVAIIIGSMLVVSVGGFVLYWFIIKRKTWAEFVKALEKIKNKLIKKPE